MIVFFTFFRHYFAIATNPGEQFYLFTSLSAWLIRKTGRHMEPPQEYDDPNSTVSSILDHLRQLVGLHFIFCLPDQHSLAFLSSYS